MLPGIDLAGSLLGLLAGAALLPAADARDIIRRAVAADERNWKIASTYEFSERVDDRRLDSQGRLKSREVERFDVVLVDGSPYRRLAGRSDLPLLPKDEMKQQEKLASIQAARRSENNAQRARRVSDYVRRPEWQREAWRELPEAFDFRMVREEVWNGDKVYVIQASPRPGYQAQSRTAKVLAHLRATLWIHKQDYHLVKAEVEAIDTISVGLVLVRLAKGSRAAFEQTWVNGEVWMLRRVQLTASARLGLLKVLHMDHEIVYSECRDPRSSALVGSVHREPVMAAEQRR